MIKKTKSPLRFSLKLVVALLALNMVFFACSGPVQKDDIDISSQNDKAKIEETTSDVFMVVEKMPEYPGGRDTLFNFLSTNIEYPKDAKEKGIQGVVILNFIVTKDGSIDSIKVKHGIGVGCDKEAVRVVSLMPNWSPGIQRGKPVNVSINLPIKFLLDDIAADSVYTVVENMPQFPGGQEKLMAYIGNNIKYPEAAKKAGVSGKVFVSFVVGVDGSIDEPHVIRGIGSGCDAEALRVVNSMPNWTPGTTNNKPVRVKYTLPIKYQLE